MEIPAFLPKLVLGTMVFLLVQVVLRANRRLPAVAMASGAGGLGPCELRHSRLIAGTGLASLLFSALLVAGTSLVALRGPFQPSPLLLLLPIGAALVGAYLVIEGHSRIVMDAEGLTRVAAFRRPIGLPWEAMESVRYRRFGESFVVAGSVAGRPVRVTVAANRRGIDELVAELLARLGPERLDSALRDFARHKLLAGRRTWRVQSGRPFAAGQVLRPRSYGEGSRLRLSVGQVEYAPDLGFVVHVSLHGAPLLHDSGALSDGSADELPEHLALAEEALLESDLEAVVETPRLEGFEPGYRAWQAAYRRGQAELLRAPLAVRVEELAGRALAANA